VNRVAGPPVGEFLRGLVEILQYLAVEVSISPAGVVVTTSPGMVSTSRRRFCSCDRKLLRRVALLYVRTAPLESRYPLGAGTRETLLVTQIELPSLRRYFFSI